MAMAALSGFHAVILKEQVLSGRKNFYFKENLVLLGDRHGNYLGQMCRSSAASSIRVAGTEGSSTGKKGPTSKKLMSSKAGRGEAVMAFRDEVAVCALASATLDRIALSPPRREVLKDGVSGVTSQGRELQSAGDSATSLERSRLESQWTMSVRYNIDRDLPELESRCLTKEGEETSEQGNLAATAIGRKPVSSGKPKARSRRLEARQQRMSSSEKRSPLGAFTIFPRKRVESRSDNSRRVDGVQGYLSTYLREIIKIDRLTADEEMMLSKLVRAGYLMKQEREKSEKAIGHELSRNQWAALLHLKVADLDLKLHEAELARDRMVMANLRLVVSVVKQYSCEGLEVADLIQEGSIGLLKGVEKFDYNRGYKLSTYVHWWIRQGVTRAIADHSRTVRLPVHVHDALGRIRRTKARMIQDGDPATVETLSEALNLSNSQIKNALKVPKRLKSLDKQVGHQKNFLTGDSETFHSLVPDLHADNQPWTVVEREQLKEDVDKILNTHLGSRERDIIKMHFGVNSEGGYPMSLESISHRYGISRERVRQLERAAMRKLQAAPIGLDRNCCMLI